MTKKETAQLMAVLKVAYPRYYQGMSVAEAKQAVALWYSMLLDYPYEQVMQGVRAVIAVQKFPPTIAEVIEQMQMLTTKSTMGEIQAWVMVKQALRNGYYHSVEEFGKLPAEIQVTIGRHETLREWAQVDTASVETVVGSHFMRAYRAKQRQLKTQMALPTDVRALTEVATEGLDMRIVIDGGEMS